VLSSNSCPNHFSVCQESECAGEISTRAAHTDMYFEIPLYPVIAIETTDTTCANGTVAMALNGVGIESMSNTVPRCVKPSVGGQSSGDKSCDIIGIRDGTKYCGDAVAADARSFDKCGGHVDDRGMYHYHIPPACLLNQLADTMLNENIDVIAHSPQVGWALDGFPVYGPVGPTGILMMPCGVEGSHPVFCLDECNGLYFQLEGVDEYMYRYYISGEQGTGECSEYVNNAGNCSRVESKCCVSTVPSPTFQPYTIGCFKGCPYDKPDCLASGNTPSTTESFYPRLSSYPKSVYIPGKAEESVDAFPVITDEIIESDTSVDTFDQYKGHGFTAVRMLGGGLGMIGTNTETKTNLIEEFTVGDRDAYITGLSLGYRGDREDNSELLFTTQEGLYSMKESGEDINRFVSGVKTIAIQGYNLAHSMNDIKYITVKDMNCSRIELVNPMKILCTVVHLRGTDKVEDNDVVVSTVTSLSTGIHLQPLTISRGNSKRAVVSKITDTSYPFRPYTVAYPINSPYMTHSANTYIYWSDLGSHRIYRCTATGQSLEVVMDGAKRVYGILPIHISEGGISDQYLFYIDAERGVLGRLLLSSQVPGTTISPNSSEDVVILKGLQEPRGLAGDVARGYIYMTFFEGSVYKLELHQLSLISTTFSDALGLAPALQNTPRWMTRVLRAPTSSRFDGIGVFPLASNANSTFKSWNEQYISVPDTSNNQVNILSEDSFTMSRLSVYNGLGSNAIVWPRSIAVRRSYTSDRAGVAYIGEFLGKIWSVDIELDNSNGGKIGTESIGTPKVLCDFSNYDASNELRRMVRARKRSEDRKVVLFPDILD